MNTSGWTNNTQSWDALNSSIDSVMESKNIGMTAKRLLTARTKEFRLLPPAEQPKHFATLVRVYQQQVDTLIKAYENSVSTVEMARPFVDNSVSGSNDSLSLETTVKEQEELLRFQGEELAKIREERDDLEYAAENSKELEREFQMMSEENRRLADKVRLLEEKEKMEMKNGDVIEVMKNRLEEVEDVLKKERIQYDEKLSFLEEQHEEEVAELNSNVDRLETELKQLQQQQQKSVAIENEIKNDEEMIEGLKQEISKLSNSLVESNNKLLEERDDFKRKMKSIEKEHENEIDECQNRIGEIEFELDQERNISKQKQEHEQEQQQETGHLQDEEEKLEKEKIALRKLREDLVGNQKLLEAEKAAFIEMKAENQNEALNTQAALKKLQESIIEDQIALKEEKKNLENIRNELKKNMENELSELQASEMQLKMEMDVKSSQLLDVQEKFGSLKIEKDSLNGECLVLQNSLEEIKEENIRLKSQLEEIRLEKTEEFQSSEDYIKKQELLVFNLKENAEADRIELDQMVAKLQNAEKGIGQLNELLEIAESKLESSTTKIADLEEKNLELKQKIEQSSAQVADATMLETEVANKHAQIIELEDEIRNKDASYVVLEDKFHEFRQIEKNKLEKALSRQTELNEAVEGKKEELTSVNEAMNGLLEQIKSRENQIEEISSEIEDLKMTCEAVTVEREEWKSRFKVKLDEIHNMSVLMTSYQRQIESSNQKYEDALKNTNTISAALEDVNAENKKLMRLVDECSATSRSDEAYEEQIRLVQEEMAANFAKEKEEITHRLLSENSSLQEKLHEEISELKNSISIGNEKQAKLIAEYDELNLQYQAKVDEFEKQLALATEDNNQDISVVIDEDDSTSQDRETSLSYSLSLVFSNLMRYLPVNVGGLLSRFFRHPDDLERND